MKVHETRSHAHSSGDEERMVTRKQKAESSKEHESEHSHKKPKPENKDIDKEKEDGHQNGGRSRTDIAEDFDKFCKATREHLSIDQMRKILEANGQDSSEASVSDDAVVPGCEDLLFYGPVKDCPVCSGKLNWCGTNYTCTGAYSDWSSCTFSTKDPPRKDEPVILPEFVENTAIYEMLTSHQVLKNRPTRETSPTNRPFIGMTVSLSGRLTRTHQYWKSEIERHGGKVSNSVPGVSCVIVSPAERERGGSSKVTEALEKGIPVVREAWLRDSIQKREPQPLEAYDVLSDLAPYGKGIPWDKKDPTEEAIESLTTELKMYGKRGVHKDSKLVEQGGKIFEKDGILFNCAFSVCDQGRGVNEFCVMQLIMVPENQLHLYYKKGKVSADTLGEERVEEWKDVDEAVKEFARLFEELTGNEFEPWEREKKFQKKAQKFYPVDMDDGVDARHGGLALRQLGIAAVHTSLEPMVAKFMKVLCSQEIYKYALMEMALDAPDLPMGMLSNVHFKRCEEVMMEFILKVKESEETGNRVDAIWSDFSQRWFTLLHSTRPFIFHGYYDLAEHVASTFETVRDITVASHLIGDMGDSTIDDPLMDRYKKLGCTISALEKDSDDYKMILKYLEKTYEPIKVGEISYDISVENIFAVESSAAPSYDEIKKLPNKVLLWCGTRSSNLLRHLQKGFLTAPCSLPVPGYMFGKAIICSDASAEAARYGFTAVDRPEGFLVLAVVSLGKDITELTSPPKDTGELEEKKKGVKGMGQKKTEESEHFEWKDEIKVPCGSLVPGEKGSALEYNEYAVYDPKQVSIRFIVAVKYAEKDVVMDTADE